MTTPDITEVLAAWRPFLATITDWQEEIDGVTPKPTGCGPVYELENPIDRPNESFAIADMRSIKFAEPHYHTNGETEIYVVLTGAGLAVVGGKETPIETGSVVVTPPDTAHFTIPHQNLVLAVINTPPFEVENAMFITTSDPAVGFDHDQFQRLAQT